LDEVRVYNRALTFSEIQTDMTTAISTQAPNTAPSVTNPGSQIATEGDVVSLNIVASDAEGNTLTYTAGGLPTGLGISASTGVISGTVAQGSAGAYNTSVQVNDGALTTTVNFTWTVSSPPPSNTAPSVTNPGDQIATEGDVVSLNIIASDAEGNTLTYTAGGLPTGLGISASTGMISGTVAQGSAGAYNTSVQVDDGALTTTVNFTWTISLPPPSNPPDGDINDDGLVDVVDILLALRALLGEITLTPTQLLHADVAPLQNGIPAPDGQFNLGDVLVIERKGLGLITF
jgi:hypothetical protein